MRKTLTLSIVALIIGAVMPTALAGGWAMTAFDSLPDEFEAGHTYTLDYTVLQHGRTPVDVGASTVTFTDPSGRSLGFEATAIQGEPGRYTVDVTIPSAGSWTWSVSQGYFAPHEMGVTAVGQSAAPVAPAASSVDVTDVLRIVLPLAAIIAAVYTLHELAKARRRPVDAHPEVS